MKRVSAALLVLLGAAFAPPASAAYVQPSLGGGQFNAPMKHVDISFNGVEVSLHVDELVPTPRLRELEPPDAYDPSGDWAMLIDTQHNSQHGWNRGAEAVLPPVGEWIWIEQLEASPGLRVYDEFSSAPIFGTDGSSARWRWSGSMTHNYYAIENPLEAELFARYRVYIGSDSTGEPLPGYTADEVTLQFLATPLLPGDYNTDGVVDSGDYAEWTAAYGSEGASLAADGNGDGRVDAADYTVWRDHQTPIAGPAPITAPEPTAVGLLAVAVGLAAVRCQGER